MFQKITPLQWEYLGKPESVCILRFESKIFFYRALHRINMGDIPCEDLLLDNKGNVAPNTIVIPVNMLEEFKNPNWGMAETFQITIVQ